MESGNYILPFLWMKGESNEIIREEIEHIYACGIKSICVESRPHPDFLGEKWWKDLRFVIDIAKEKSMKVWILDDAHFPTGYANNLIVNKYPERKKVYINFNTIDVWGIKGEVTIPAMKMVKPLRSFLELHIPYDYERDNNKLLSVVAYPLVMDDVIDNTKPIPLTDLVNEEGFIFYEFPEGSFRVFVFYETKTDGGRPEYINIIDEESVSTLIEAVYEPHYNQFKEEFGGVIAGFFSDEPGFGNCNGFDMDDKLGKKVALPWSKNVPVMLEERLGKDWSNYLALLWFNSVDKYEMAKVRFAYMDTVTTLYKKNFSQQLGKWCEKHGVEYIGHVIEDNNEHARLGPGAGHYFRAMEGQHMSGIDIIADQISFGGSGLSGGGIFKSDGEFNHFSLCKLGVSSAHFDSKKKGRTVCEIFGAFGWKFGVRGMKYVIDEALINGVNYFVPHAFSMSEYPDKDCPPHFYARGHFPQIQHFAELMKYTNRMCEIINDGKIIAPVGILYHAEAEWTGESMLMQKPAKLLAEAQIDYLFIPGEYLDKQDFKALVIPTAEYIAEDLYLFLKNNNSLPIYFINEFPKGIANLTISKEDFAAVLNKCEVVKLENLVDELKKKNIIDIGINIPFTKLRYLHYNKKIDYYLFQNQSISDTFRGKIQLPLKNGAVYFDVFANEYYNLPVEVSDGKSSIEIELPIYHSCVILDSYMPELPEYVMKEKQSLEMKKSLDISDSWIYELSEHGDYPNFIIKGELDKLIPISRIHPNFSGHIAYEKIFNVFEDINIAFLEIEGISETMDLWVNEEYAGMCITPPYRYEISKFIKRGINKIRIEVATTLDRDQLNYPDPLVNLNFTPMEATGMYGEVKILY